VILYSFNEIESWIYEEIASCGFINNPNQTFSDSFKIYLINFLVYQKKEIQNVKQDRIELFLYKL